MPLTIPSIAGLSIAAGAAAQGQVSHTPVLVWAAQAIGAGYVTISGSPTFTVQAGDAIVVEFSGLANANQGDPTMTGVVLNQHVPAYNAWSSSANPYGGYYVGQNPTVGSQTVTPPVIAGGQDGLIAVYRVPNMPAAVTVRTAGKVVQATAAKTVTVTTAGNVTSGDIAFGYRSHENSVGSTDTLTPPAGWTSDAQYLNGTLNLPTDWSHLTVSASGSPLSGLWTSVDNAITCTCGAILVLAPT